MSATFFVNTTNPEIFTATPRPGGIANIQLPERKKRPKRTSDGSASKSKLQSESKSTSKVMLKTKSRSKTKSKTTDSKTSAASSSRTSATSKKSLLTVGTTYNEPIDLDIDRCPRRYKVQQIIAATPWSVEFDEYLEPSEESKRIPDPFQDAVDMLAMTISVIMLLSKGYNKIGDSQFKWVISYLKCIKDEFGKTPPNVQGILNHINMVTGGKIKSFLEETEDDEEPSELKKKNVAEPSSAATAEQE